MRRLLLLVSSAATLLGADVSGIWMGQIPARNNETKDISFRLMQSGDRIAGKMYGDNASSPIADGRISGGRIIFSVTVEEQVGNLFLPIKYTFSGCVDPGDNPKDAEIQLTREREAPPNNDLGGNNPSRAPAKPSLKLRRLL